MKKLVLPFALLCLFFGTAQTDKNVEDNQLTVNVLLPGLVYEKGVSNNTTLTAEVTMGFALTGCTGCETDFGIYPIGRLQYRYYYNFDRRLQRGKRISGNSGNYLSPMIAGQSGNSVVGDLDFDSSFFAGVGGVYGLQRTSPKGFQFRLEAGPAYIFDEFGNGFGLFLAAKLGWVIRKRK